MLNKLNLLIKESSVIGVVSNDAGGAVQLTHFMKNLVDRPAYYSLITGPAFRIWKSSQMDFGIPIQENSLEVTLGKCNLIITSTGYMTNLEKNAVSIGRSINIPVISVLDHWVGYRGRFGKLETDLPNFIAVNNSVAHRKAAESFPDVPIFCYPDYQLENFRNNQKKNQFGIRNSLLVILEPIDQTAVSQNQISLINLWLDLIRISVDFAKKNKLTLILREHPAEKINKQILEAVANDTDYRYIISRQTLEEDLLKTKYTIGVSSHALYLSSELGIPTYSVFAGQKNHWTKDFLNIHPLSNLMLSSESK
jgi:hypothetical protein